MTDPSDPPEPFRRRFAKAYRLGAVLALVLGCAFALIAIIRGESVVLPLVGALVTLVTVLPLGAAVYVVLEPLQSRGVVGHYLRWILVAFVTTSPAFFIARWTVANTIEAGGTPDPLEGKWSIYVLGTLGAAILWGGIVASIAASLRQAKDRIGRFHGG